MPEEKFCTVCEAARKDGGGSAWVCQGCMQKARVPASPPPVVITDLQAAAIGFLSGVANALITNLVKNWSKPSSPKARYYADAELNCFKCATCHTKLEGVYFLFCPECELVKRAREEVARKALFDSKG